MRVLILVTHLLGVGHLARAAALGRAFAKAGHEASLVSGGRPAPNIATTGISLVQLPSLHIEGTDFKKLFDETGAIASDRTLADREASLRDVVARVRPDAVIVELFPFGRRQLADEHMKFCISVHERHGQGDGFRGHDPVEVTFSIPDPCFVACSIRDVLNPPSKISKTIFADEVLARYFDGVLVHGDPSILGLKSSWPVSPGLERCLAYTGYVRDGNDGHATGGMSMPGHRVSEVSGSASPSGVGSGRVASPVSRVWNEEPLAGTTSANTFGAGADPGPDRDPSMARAVPHRHGRGGGASPPAGAEAGSEPQAGSPAQEILVSGGGSTASLPLMRAALAAATLDPGRSWRLLIGHGVPAADFEALVAAAPANAVVERVRKDFPALLAACACSVSQIGYNTALDLASAGCPAVVVPFDAGNEVEQVIRAEKFAEIGLVQVVRAADLSGEALVEAIERAVALAGEDGSHRKESPRLAMDGAAATVRLVEEGVARKREAASLWRQIGRDLDALAGQGRELRFWWRDDDAVAPSPALDRLLHLRRTLEIPLALAVIPQLATQELAIRLRAESAVDVLVHGVAHRNNSEPGAKKQELTVASDIVVETLRSGRERLEALFGQLALPVLVPPWNRIAPGLVPRLPEAGFLGLSTYGNAGANPGIRQVNTHLDPIDWRGGGGLVRAPAHIAALAAVITDRVRSSSSTTEPIGLLTHHLVHDPWIWAFVEDVLKRLKTHRSVRFVSARELIGLT